MISKVRDKFEQFRILMESHHHRCEVCGQESTWQCDQCHGWRCDDHQEEVWDRFDRWTRICAAPKCIDVTRA